jgi:hypothetical protein
MWTFLLSILLSATAPAEQQLVVLKGGTALTAVRVVERGELLLVETADGGLYTLRREQLERVEPLKPEQPAAAVSPTSDPQPARPRKTFHQRNNPLPTRTGGRGGSLSVLGSPTSPGAPLNPPKPASVLEAEAAQREQEREYWMGRAREQLEQIGELRSEIDQLEAQKRGWHNLQKAMVRAGKQPIVTGDLYFIERRLQALQPKLEKAREQWLDFKQEARRAGVPPGWLRPDAPGRTY